MDTGEHGLQLTLAKLKLVPISSVPGQWIDSRFASKDWAAQVRAKGDCSMTSNTERVFCTA